MTSINSVDFREGYGSLICLCSNVLNMTGFAGSEVDGGKYLRCGKCGREYTLFLGHVKKEASRRCGLCGGSGGSMSEQGEPCFACHGTGVAK
jgi:hypothetical protein